MSNQPTRQVLDVEDDDARQQRIRALLEHTDAAIAPRRARPFPTLPPSRPHPVPLSDLISRAEAFLPRLAASNADLARRAAADPTSVDIEHLGENSDASHIEMTLGLGVFEQRRPCRAHGSHQTDHGQPSDSSADSSGSEDSDGSSEHDSKDSDDSDDSKDDDGNEETPRDTQTALSSDIDANGG